MILLFSALLLFFFFSLVAGWQPGRGKGTGKRSTIRTSAYSKQNMQLFVTEYTDATSDTCVSLVNADFSIVKVGLAGALAGGFRGHFHFTFTSLHFTSLHFTSFHFTSLNLS